MSCRWRELPSPIASVRPGALAVIAGLLSLLFTALFPSAAKAQFDLTAPGDKPKATVELLVPGDTVKPGQTVPIGVKFTMEPGWHIYWKNPGDSGQAPSFGWTLPGGGASRMLRGGEWTATAPRFPTPEQFTDDAGFVTYGYSDTIIFPAELTVPASATPGQSVEVSLATEYLVCADVCLPESAVTTVELQVGTDVQEDREVMQQLEAAAERVPVSAESSRLVKSIDVRAPDAQQREMTIEFAGPVEQVEFFPNPPTGMAIEEVEVEHTHDQATIRFRARPLTGATIRELKYEAVVGFTAAGDRHGVTTDIPIEDTVDE